MWLIFIKVSDSTTLCKSLKSQQIDTDCQAVLNLGMLVLKFKFLNFGIVILKIKKWALIKVFLLEGLKMTIHGGKMGKSLSTMSLAKGGIIVDFMNSSLKNSRTGQLY